MDCNQAGVKPPKLDPGMAALDGLLGREAVSGKSCKQDQAEAQHLRMHCTPGVVCNLKASSGSREGCHEGEGNGKKSRKE